MANKPKGRTVGHPTGEISALFKLRVCATHKGPVGLLSETSKEPFLCLAHLHRMDIEGTTTVETNVQRMKKGDL